MHDLPADRQPVIAGALRTPIGRHGGALSPVRPDDLAALVLRALAERAGIDPAVIDDVYFGAANQAGEDNRNVARMAVLLAGLPVEIPGVTVNRLCASSLSALNMAAMAVASGQADVVVAGGVESMSRAPWVVPKPETGLPRGDLAMVDTTLGWRLVNPKMADLHGVLSMGQTAECVAERHGVSRADQDAWALRSQQRWAEAAERKAWREEIVPVPVPQRKGDPVLVEVDEHPRPDTTMEQLARLRPAFNPDGTVTAGNSSGLNDGAAAVLVTSRRRAAELGLDAPFRIVAGAAAGVHPDVMGIGPVPATRRVLDRAGVSIADVDLVELNEAFAAQVLACQRELGIDPERLNVNGGAIAIGHPLGASGVRIATTLVHEMGRSGARLGLATMCVGVGQGVSTLIEQTG
ncbi:MAG: acetyl-CoA C-acyltransferase [Actinomycetota bacterium]|nr:acetyl-CoA C-acyltransferase [Actinomycetota bacterium]